MNTKKSVKKSCNRKYTYKYLRELIVLLNKKTTYNASVKVVGKGITYELRLNNETFEPESARDCCKHVLGMMYAIGIAEKNKPADQDRLIDYIHALETNAMCDKENLEEATSNFEKAHNAGIEHAKKIEIGLVVIRRLEAKLKDTEHLLASSDYKLNTAMAELSSFKRTTHDEVMDLKSEVYKLELVIKMNRKEIAYLEKSIAKWVNGDFNSKTKAIDAEQRLSNDPLRCTQWMWSLFIHRMIKPEHIGMIARAITPYAANPEYMVKNPEIWAGWLISHYWDTMRPTWEASDK